jgi:hypothetical protein
MRLLDTFASAGWRICLFYDVLPSHAGNELNNRSYCQRNDYRPDAHFPT